MVPANNRAPISLSFAKGIRTFIVGTVYNANGVFEIRLGKGTVARMRVVRGEYSVLQSEAEQLEHRAKRLEEQISLLEDDDDDGGDGDQLRASLAKARKQAEEKRRAMNRTLDKLASIRDKLLETSVRILVNMADVQVLPHFQSHVLARRSGRGLADDLMHSCHGAFRLVFPC